MATYKVLQDIEAEDKLLGPLTLRQFIYASIAGIFIYLSFVAATKHASFLLIIFLPIIIFCGFFAWPWHLNQTAEIWALGKIRFLLKPHKRIWDQTGVKELVNITVPKKEVVNYTDGLSQTEVKSRLKALATTLDTRGWAIKNTDLNYNQFQRPTSQDGDRLIEINQLSVSSQPSDVQASDDILDEQNNPTAQHFKQLISNSDQKRRDKIVRSLSNTPQDQATNHSANDNNLWFSPGTQQVPQVSIRNQQALAEQPIPNQSEPDIVNANLHQLKVPPAPVQSINTKPVSTAKKIETERYARNDDLNVATIARQVNNDKTDEVIVNLH